MPSKSDTARANGAKSRGPKTPEGRAKSSRNALRHGLTAETIVITTESEEQFQLLLDAHVNQFQPANDIELELVEAMAAARWRLRRIRGIEMSIFDMNLVKMADDMDQSLDRMSDNERTAYVFERIADNRRSLDLVVRYEASANRAYDRAFKHLQLLQSTRQPELRNEPNPPDADPPPAPSAHTEPRASASGQILQPPSIRPTTPKPTPKPVIVTTEGAPPLPD